MMKGFVGSVKSRIQKLADEIIALEERLEKKRALLDKYLELLDLEGGAPEEFAELIKLAARRNVKVPPRRQRKGKDTLPTLIVDVLSKHGKPMRAREIYEELVELGWSTNSDKPEAMVYKTLFRIEKEGQIAKAARGKFTLL